MICKCADLAFIFYSIYFYLVKFTRAKNRIVKVSVPFFGITSALSQFWLLYGRDLVMIKNDDLFDQNLFISIHALSLMTYSVYNKELDYETSEYAPRNGIDLQA